jgi:hypothetical protein
MSKFITVDEGLWDKLEADNKRLTKMVDDICYTAKSRKIKMHKYRDVLKSIGSWSQELQDRAAEMKTEGMMWRGCVAEANAALERGGDAVEGRERVYPEGYLEGLKGKDDE